MPYQIVVGKEGKRRFVQRQGDIIAPQFNQTYAPFTRKMGNSLIATSIMRPIKSDISGGMIDAETAEQIFAILREDAERQFRMGGDPPWRPLAPATLREKSRRFYREYGSPANMEYKRRKLGSQFYLSPNSDERTEFGSKKVAWTLQNQVIAIRQGMFRRAFGSKANPDERFGKFMFTNLTERGIKKARRNEYTGRFQRQEMLSPNVVFGVGAGQILIDRGNLMASWTIKGHKDHIEAIVYNTGGSMELVFGSKDPKASYHQHGTSRMPARGVYIGLQARQKIAEITRSDAADRAVESIIKSLVSDSKLLTKIKDPLTGKTKSVTTFSRIASRRYY